MQQPYLLPGSLPSTKRRTNLAPVFITVFLAVFLVGGYLIWERMPTSPRPTPSAPAVAKDQSAPAAAMDTFMEDLDLHLQNAIQSNIRASELVRQSQRRIRAVLPAMERNYLELERARLQAANSLAEKAVLESTHASEELEVAQKLTKQHITEGGKQ